MFMSDLSSKARQQQKRRMSPVRRVSPSTTSAAASLNNIQISSLNSEVQSKAIVRLLLQRSGSP